MNTAISNAPRGVLAAKRGLLAVRAEGGPTDVKTAIEAVNEGFKTFKASQDRRADNVQKAVDDINAKIAAITLNGPAANDNDLVPVDAEYSQLFKAYAHGGVGSHELLAANRDGDRAKINAAMTASPGEAGGYLAPVEWDRQIRKSQTALSPFRQIVSVVPTSVRAYSTLWNMGGWGSGWVGETAVRPETATAQLRPITFSHGELYAFPMISQQLLDDADFGVDQWLANEVGQEFDRQESVAFISGDGANKPRGLLTYVQGGASETEHPGGTLSIVPSGAANAVTPDGLITFVYSLTSPYRQNARWLMNSNTAAKIALLKDGQGAYLWRESYIVGQPATLLGYPVTIDENMPDAAAGSTPIAFGDFKRGYLINDRHGVRVLRDPFTNKPFVGFYTTKRVGGGVLDPNAIRLLRIAAS